MININFCRWLDSNHRPLESEVTALPTVPQPLPNHWLYVLSRMTILTNRCAHFYAKTRVGWRLLEIWWKELANFSSKQNRRLKQAWKCYKVQKYICHHWSSVNRWLDYLHNIRPFTAIKSCPSRAVLAKLGLKLWQMLNTPSKNCQRL